LAKTQLAREHGL
jgi:hypothetical protein